MQKLVELKYTVSMYEQEVLCKECGSDWSFLTDSTLNILIDRKCDM